MIKFSPFLSWFQWKSRFSFRVFAEKLLAVFGGLWLIAEIVAFSGSQLHVPVQLPWWLFLLSGLIVTLYLMRPRSSYCHKLCGRDVEIELRVADVIDVVSSFDVGGALVVPINTMFDSSLGGVVAKAASVQGRVINHYYDGDPDKLAEAIQEKLPQKVSSGETIDTETDKFPIGTVVETEKGGRKFLFLANTHINTGGRACGSLEDLKKALDSLWQHIAERGSKTEVSIPVLGTGYGRLTPKREAVVRLIVRSFVKSCSQKSYCTKLVLVLYPRDVKKHEVNLSELDAFLGSLCSFPEFLDE